MRAVVLREAGQPTTVEELTLRPLARHEVRVRLRASGVCHSDLSLRNGAIPTRVPSTLGHEGAGVVAEVGEDVTSVSPGDHVVLTWNVPCRSCPHCLRGEAHLCLHGYDHAYGDLHVFQTAGATGVPGTTGRRRPAAAGARAAAPLPGVRPRLPASPTTPPPPRSPPLKRHALCGGFRAHHG